MPNIKLVAAFREDSLKSDFGCIISDTPDSEITSEYDLSDSESGSVLYSYGNNMFTPESDWEAEIIEEEIEQEAMRVEAYLASDTTDNSKDFETWDVELRREVVELNDDDNNFIEVMGYDFSSIEDRCIWVGYDYLGMRAEL